MTKRMAVLALAVGMTIPGFMQTGFTQALAQTGVPQKRPKVSAAAPGAVTKAYLQKIWDGWATLDAAAQKQYYAQGPHVFFDIAPLKYASWDEYQVGVSKDLATYKAARFVVNDDAQIHKSGEAYWSTATIASDMTRKSDKREMTTFRWTAVFEKQNGTWLIVHEHVSMAQPD
ncbi:MAG TPA: nuclear transport factor 2 family protein [Terriglobales bacterium]|nr:nuclear transport factor 2 family protein [Terriglobales bacterium]